MAAINLPNKFWRPLAEVKNFVEKMSDGVKLPHMSQKVKSFANLSRKDKDILIRYLNERDCIHVIQARPNNGGNLTTFFYHHKYGLPEKIVGYDWSGKKPKIVMPVEEVSVSTLTLPNIVKESESLPEPESEPEPMAVPELKKELKKSVPDESNEIATEPDDGDVDETLNSESGFDADSLRKRALEMLMQADEAEQSRLSKVLTSEIKPKIDEYISRLNEANDAVQSTLDKLYDQMADLDKVSMEFKNFTASL